LPFTLYQDVAATSELKINGEPATLDEDYWTNASYLPTNALKTNAIIYVGSEFNEKTKLDVKGKILVATENEENSLRKVAAAQKLGAAAMIIVSKNNTNAPSANTGRPRLAQKPTGFSYFKVT
jgi:hypothetical protein